MGGDKMPGLIADVAEPPVVVDTAVVVADAMDVAGIADTVVVGQQQPVVAAGAGRGIVGYQKAQPLEQGHCTRKADCMMVADEADAGQQRFGAGEGIPVKESFASSPEGQGR